eukprot:364868-Chlamydomonas_euryale.AAC.17
MPHAWTQGGAVQIPTTLYGRRVDSGARGFRRADAGTLERWLLAYHEAEGNSQHGRLCRKPSACSHGSAQEALQLFWTRTGAFPTRISSLWSPRGGQFLLSSLFSIARRREIRAAAGCKLPLPPDVHVFLRPTRRKSGQWTPPITQGQVAAVQPFRTGKQPQLDGVGAAAAARWRSEC